MKCPTCGNPKMTATVKPYKYDISGLPNVVLQGIKIFECDKCGEEAPVIPAMSELHRVLAMAVVSKPTSLTPAEFRFLRKYLGYSSTDLSKLLDVRKETMSRWERGTVSINPLADRFMRLAVALNVRVQDYPVDQLKDIQEADPKVEEPFWLSRGADGWVVGKAA